MNAEKKDNFRPDIQGLRAIAVLAVMAFHFNPKLLPGGFVGVDIFLVVSGFLITSILLRIKSQADYKLISTLRYFYSSRLKRIVPAYLAMLLITSLVAAILFLPEDFSTYKQSLDNALWFNSNNYFSSFGNYFAPANHEQPLLHTWSLAIEIQFYIAAPFIFLLLAKQKLKWLLPLAIVALTAYAEYRLRFLGMEQATYYSLAARLPAFFIGALAAIFFEQLNSTKKVTSKSNGYLQWLALTFIILSFLQPKITGYFPGLAGLLPAIGAAIFLLANTNDLSFHILSNRILVWVGTLSYSLYLWHWPVLAFFRYYTGGEILTPRYCLAFVSLTFLLAILSYYLVENSLRSRENKLQIIRYTCLLLLTLTTALGATKVNNYFSPPPLPIEYKRYANPSEICHGKVIGDCLQGRLSSSSEVLVLGDSHAAMLNYFFDYLGNHLNFKARIITASSCVTIPRFDYQRIAEWAQKDCINQINTASKVIPESRTIFLAALWSWQIESSDFKNALEKFLEQTNKKRQAVYLISQEPLLNHGPLRNLRFKELGIANASTTSKASLVANTYLRSQAERYEFVNFLDLSHLNIFTRLPFYNGKIIYYDEHHMNEVGIKEYAKEALNIISDLNITTH